METAACVAMVSSCWTLLNKAVVWSSSSSSLRSAKPDGLEVMLGNDWPSLGILDLGCLDTAFLFLAASFATDCKIAAGSKSPSSLS